MKKLSFLIFSIVCSAIFASSVSAATTPAADDLCTQSGSRCVNADFDCSSFGAQEVDVSCGSRGGKCCRVTPTDCSRDGGVCVGTGNNCSATNGYTEVALSCAPGGGKCCKRSSATGGNTTASGNTTTTASSSEVSINISNPLKYNTVEGVLTSVMSGIKGIVITLALLMIVIGAVMYILSFGNDSNMKRAKGLITAALVGLAIVMAAPAFLKEIAGLLGWGAETEGLSGTLSLTQIAKNILNFLLSIIGTLALIVMVISGIMYLTSAGSESRIKQAKQMFIAALIGITLAMASLILVNAIARFFV